MGSTPLPISGVNFGGLSPQSTFPSFTQGSGLSPNTQGILGGLIGGGLQSLGNAFGGPTPGTQSTKSTSSSTSTPTYSSAVLPLYNSLLSSYLGLSNKSNTDNLFNNYRTQGQQQINATSEGSKDSLNQILASRGLLNTPAGGYATIASELNRQTQQNQFVNSIPLLQDQYYRSGLGQAGNFFASLPYGTSQTGNQDSTTTYTPPKQSWLSGLLGGVAQALPAALAAF